MVGQETELETHQAEVDGSSIRGLIPEWIN